MRVLILSARTGWHTDELSRALTARGHQSQVAPYESLVAGFGRSDRSNRSECSLEFSASPAAHMNAPHVSNDRNVSNDSNVSHDSNDPNGSNGSNGSNVLNAFAFDAVLARIIPNGSLEQIIYRVDALHWIEDRGIPVVNSAQAIERSVDKFYTTALLQEAGLPVPETVVCERAADAMAAIGRILDSGAEVIVKPIFGSMGHGLVRIADMDVAWRVVRPLEQVRSVFYVQRAIDHGGRDVRLFVVGGEVVGAIERTAAPGDWRTNVARGGSARGINAPQDWCESAIAAAEAVGADYAGVDLLLSSSGEMFVLEVNGIPGWQGLQGSTGVDIAAAIVAQIETRADHRRPLAEEVHA
jgi:RimK family alpha-L-glutamate ligase